MFKLGQRVVFKGEVCIVCAIRDKRRFAITQRQEDAISLEMLWADEIKSGAMVYLSEYSHRRMTWVGAQEIKPHLINEE